jgi:DNA-binding NarL/FixJ family response regulator
VVAAVDNAPSLERALARADIDIAILDVRLPPTHTTEGLAAAAAARAARPGLPVLVLSQWVEPLYARNLLASGEGSVGYLLKDRVSDVDSFLAAVRQVAGGGTVLDPQVVAALVGARRGPVDRLTEREKDVLTLMAEGRSNAAIAGRLYVSDKAVDKHITSIFSKLDLPPAPDDNRRVLAVLAWLQAS